METQQLLYYLNNLYSYQNKRCFENEEVLNKINDLIDIMNFEIVDITTIINKCIQIKLDLKNPLLFNNILNKMRFNIIKHNKNYDYNSHQLLIKLGCKNILPEYQIYYFNEIPEYKTFDKIHINKISYPFKSTQYYSKINEKIKQLTFNTSLDNDNYIFNTFQCYFKAALNFFLNNGEFLINYFTYDNERKQNKYNTSYDNETSDIVDSLKLGGGLNKIFRDAIIKINNNEYYDDLFIKIKDEIINKLDKKEINNIYDLGIPGNKIYSYYVIQDLLMLFNNKFSNDCIIDQELLAPAEGCTCNLDY